MASPTRSTMSEEFTYEVISNNSNENMMVAVRVRPENEREQNSKQRNIIRCLDDNILIFDPKDDEISSQVRAKGRPSMLQPRRRDVRYAFDYLFDEFSTQKQVFEKTCKRLIDGILNGFNGTMFAYGATGAGKTHTMLGTETEPGIMVYTVEELFKRMKESQSDRTYELEVSYLEIYNERIRDLLVSGPPLMLREDPQKGSIVGGLSFHKPTDVNDLFSMLAFGNLNRTQHPTDANATSSRSHAVFQIYVQQKARTAALSANIHVAKLSLIDLAGSERATATTNRGNRLREGANINRSLLALGNCINALVDRDCKNIRHIPYRDSKLTRLLKDSLGGNTRTIMIANISPSGLTYDDTHNTLKYANRAKNIKTRVTRNVLSVDYHVSKYKEIVKELQEEIKELKRKLVSVAGKTSQPARGNQMAAGEGGKVPSGDKLKADKMSVEISQIFSRKKEMIDLMHSKRKLEQQIRWKIEKKNKVQNRADFLYSTPIKKDKFNNKMGNELDLLRGKHEKIKVVLSQLSAEMEGLDGRIQQISAQVNQIQTYETAELLLGMFSLHQVQMENLELKYCLELEELEKSHLVDETRECEDKFERLVGIIRKFYNTLKSQNHLDSALIQDYGRAIQILSEDRRVTWADCVLTPSKAACVDESANGSKSMPASSRAFSSAFSGTPDKTKKNLSQVLRDLSSPAGRNKCPPQNLTVVESKTKENGENLKPSLLLNLNRSTSLKSVHESASVKGISTSASANLHPHPNHTTSLSPSSTCLSSSSTCTTTTTSSSSTSSTLTSSSLKEKPRRLNAGYASMTLSAAFKTRDRSHLSVRAQPKISRV